MNSYKIFFRPQVIKFVLFLVGRVGSTYLTSLMQSHPHILARSEELTDLMEQGAEAQIKWSEKFLTPPMIGQYKVRGFNVKLAELCAPDKFVKLINEKDCKIIHMQRRNRVKVVISRLNGERLYERTGMWGLFNETNRLPPLLVDLEKFDAYLKHREKMDLEMETYVNSLGRPTLRLYYEDLLVGQNDFLRTLFDFLEVDQYQVKGKTLKITDDDLRKSISNFDELHGRYVGTQYEQMFNEVST